MQKFELFFQFLGKSFFNTLVSLGSESAMVLQKYLHWNMLFRDSEIEGIPKIANSIEFLHVATDYSPRTQGSILAFRFESETFHL